MQAHAALLEPANYAGIESDLTWLGVAGLLDPPRPEVRGAIANCMLAGIRVRGQLATPDAHTTPTIPDTTSNGQAKCRAKLQAFLSGLVAQSAMHLA